MPSKKFRKRLVAEEASRYFHSPYNQFVFTRTYARWLEKEQRRETWPETVSRYMNFMRSQLGNKLSDKTYTEIHQAILKQEVMPSMRLLQFAGAAAGENNICTYNCSYIAPCTIRDFAEILYISMCGVGVGFSVEKTNVAKLPLVKKQTGAKLKKYMIGDSKAGWANALRKGMQAWCAGNDIDFDFSKVRAAGAKIKLMGGKSARPLPLKNLLQFVRYTILQAQGKQLDTLQVYDIICKIGETVVAGGVRRSAMISLSDLDNEKMQNAKKGNFFLENPQRSITNNSAVYLDRPTNQQLLTEWTALANSGTGERGIFNRGGLIYNLPKRRLAIFKKLGLINGDKISGMIGANPCGEIILLNKQFCNLSEVIARPNDNAKTLLRKIRIATIIGTFQATLTRFPYISKQWQKNCELERLLGVSITGIWDCPTVRNKSLLIRLKKHAIKINQQLARHFGIRASTAVTCIKPSGTVSQVTDCAPGMHPRFAHYYLRRVRIAATDALFKLLRDQCVPYYPEVGQDPTSATTFVIEFPIAATDSSITRDDLTAIEQLEFWKLVKINYTEHNPSVTITVNDNEWIEVLNWLKNNWNYIGGLSFLPREHHVYQLAPYEKISQSRYQALIKKFPALDFSKLSRYELTDETDIFYELACPPQGCDLT